MGDSISEGSIASWKKQIGDIVLTDEVVCVIDTDKVSVDVHSAVSGRVVSQAAAEGETVLVGGDLLTIDTTVNVSSPNTGDSSDHQDPDRIASESPVPDESQRNMVGRNTMSGTTRTLSTRVPMIKFCYGYNSTNNNVKGSGKKPADSPPSTSRPPIQRATVERYVDFSELPSQYKSRDLTVQEIETVNSGGVTDALDKFKFKSVVTRYIVLNK